jgi:hypothetical protein
LEPFDARTLRMLALQTRILAMRVPMPDRPSDLLVQMRNVLLAASNEEVLFTSPLEVPKPLKMSRQSDGKVSIVGGTKDQSRARDLPRFKRRDGAWFHFTLTVAEQPKLPLELVAYDFELCFTEDPATPFVRFDLNPPAHHNEEEGLRSHVHLSTDDFSVPSMVLSPLEVLDVLLYDLRLKRDKPRA